jgi:hypothetical protein
MTHFTPFFFSNVTLDTLRAGSDRARSYLAPPSRDHKRRRAVEALERLYRSGCIDDSAKQRLKKVNQYLRDHGYETVERSTVSRALATLLRRRA